VFEEVLRPIAAQMAEFKRMIQESFGPLFQRVSKAFADLPPQAQRAVLALANHGWFFDLEMTPADLWQLEKLFSNGDAEQAEEALTEYFECRVGDIQAATIKRFPNRKACLEEAFQAHVNGSYYLSIPVLFAQTDGICKETVGHYLFIRKDKKPSTAIYVEQLADDTLHAAFLAALAFPLPIGASERERGGDFIELNRHMVLHGESTDYGTKINSLKAISLLNYVAKNLPEKVIDAADE
jgi:hypothetical protein